MNVSKSRRALGVAAAATLAVASLFATSGTASADDMSAQDTCDRGEVCVYMGNTLIDSSEGNLSGPYGPFDVQGKIVNNGWQHGGADHIRYTLSTGGTPCLHFPGDGNNVGVIPAGATVSNIRWGGDC